MTTIDADPFARPDAPGEGVAPGEDLIVGGRYKVPDPDGGPKWLKYTRATTFAKTVADTYRLSLWQQRMAIKGAVSDDGLYAAIASTSLDDRKELDRLVEQCKEKAGAKTRATLGTAVHAFCEQIDRGEITLADVPGPWRPDVAAYGRLMDDLGLEVVLNERTVMCRTYDIVGTLDRVVRLTKELVVRLPDDSLRVLPAGTMLILDLKTGRTLEYGWREIAIQLALYANSELVLTPERDGYDPMPEEVDTEVGLVVHLPVGEGKATLYAMDLARGWRAAWLCQQVRSWNRLEDLASPVLVVESADKVSLTANEPRAIEARQPSWTERIASAMTVTGLARIRIEAIRAETWTPALQHQAEKRRDDILADVAGS